MPTIGEKVTAIEEGRRPRVLILGGGLQARTRLWLFPVYRSM